ncbi:hypothetical protein HDU98_001014, partial [Podochytrium sp. JEL0797]
MVRVRKPIAHFERLDLAQQKVEVKEAVLRYKGHNIERLLGAGGKLPSSAKVQRQEKMQSTLDGILREAEKRKWKAPRGGLTKTQKENKYITSFMDKLTTFLLDGKYGVVDLGVTTKDEADAVFAKDNIVLLYLNKDLVMVVLQREFEFPQAFRDKYTDAYTDYFDSFEKREILPQPEPMSSHSNRFPERVSRSGKLDLSLGFMQGWSKNLTTELKFREDCFGRSWKLAGSNTFTAKTAFTPRLMDQLNDLFFPGSLERKLAID